MTVRKPAHLTWESFVERQIREAQERDEFARIIEVNSKATSGPPSRLVPLEADAVVAEWRLSRTERPR